jgi:gas vesicle protein
MDVSGVGQSIESTVQGLGETGKIVRDIFQKLNEFKAETDRAIQKDILQQAREKLEELLNKVKVVTPQLQESVDKLQEAIEDAQRILRGGI